MLRQLKATSTPIDNSEEFRKEVGVLKQEIDSLRQEKFKNDKEFIQRKDAIEKKAQQDNTKLRQEL